MTLVSLGQITAHSMFMLHVAPALSRPVIRASSLGRYSQSRHQFYA